MVAVAAAVSGCEKSVVVTVDLFPRATLAMWED
jgi:hypothetical protein